MFLFHEASPDDVHKFRIYKTFIVILYWFDLNRICFNLLCRNFDLM
jgi:hypothetical protein